MARPDVFTQALRALDGGRGVAIACVIGAHGSTPRHLGARMAVADDGEQWGTVGGGRIEQLVATAARARSPPGAAPRVVRQHLVRDLAMCCGGSMEVVLTPAAGSRERDRAGRREPRAEDPGDAARRCAARRCGRPSRAIPGRITRSCRAARCSSGSAPPSARS